MNALFGSMFFSIWLACVTAKVFLIPEDVAIPATPNQFPWIVRLDKRNASGLEPFKHECGSFLIRDPDNQDQSDMVLTAAHCIQTYQGAFGDHVYMDPSRLQLVAGVHSRYLTNETGSEIRSVKRMRWPTKYNPYHIPPIHDIALIQMDKPIKFSATISPIDLPLIGEELRVGDPCTVAGWGAFSQTEKGDPKEFPKELMYSDNKIVSVSPLHYNAGHNDGTGTCKGDSGGALFRKEDSKWVAHGIVSRGFMNCETERERKLSDEYTKIEAHLDWIEKTIVEWRIEETIKEWIENS